MGQRHQIFVIARIPNRYRSLAAVHHQWLYGVDALRACQRLVKIFQAPENRHLLTLELARAAALDDKVWDADVDYESKPEFPFITTTLVLGAALGLEDAYVHGVSAEPWNMSYDGGDNNDGITILDITNPQIIRYSFVYFDFDPEDYEDDSKDDENLEDDAVSTKEIPNFSPDQNLNMVPLTGREYLGIYKARGYYKSHEHDENILSAMRNLDEVPLINFESLKSAWPKGDWVSRIHSGLIGVSNNQTDNPSKATSSTQRGLTRMAMEKAFERLLVEEDDLEMDVEELPIFLPSLRAYLYEKPEVVGKSRFGFKLLQKALSNTKELDLHLFPDLTGDQIVALAEAASEDLTLLDVSGNKHITPKDLEYAIRDKRVSKLYLWSPAHISTTAEINAVSTDSVESVIHRDLFLQALDPRNQKQFSDREELDTSLFTRVKGNAMIGYLVWVQAKNSAFDPNDSRPLAPAFHSASPLMEQLPQDSSHEAIWRWEKPLSVQYSLSDVAFTPASILAPLARAFKLFCGLPPWVHSYSSSDVKKAFPLVLSFRDPKSEIAVHPIPPRAVASNLSSFSKLPVASDKWTVMIVQEHDRTTNHEPEIVRFRLGFVNATKDGELRLCNPETFLQETGAADFEDTWKKSIMGLKTGAHSGTGEPIEPRDVEVVGLDLATVQNFNNMMEKLQALGIKP